jgi:hypothetical protein
MKTLIQSITIGALGTATWLLIGAGNLHAQDAPPRGNFDPAQMQPRMLSGLERIREQFEVKDDSEWKVISERIKKVMEARRTAGSMGGPGGFGFPGGPGGPPPPQGGERGSDGFGPQGAPEPPGGFRGGPGGFNRESNPELDALRKAIDSKASPEEIKAKLAQLRAARTRKEADLEKAQEELRQVLSVQQEAIAVTLGLLK